MEIRLLLAFLLMGLVLFVTPYFYKPPAGPKRTAPAPGAATATQAAKAPAQPAQPAPKPAPPPPTQPAAGRIAATAEQTFTVDTALYRIQFTNRGAVAQSWMLKKFLDSKGKPLELINTAVTGQVPLPFAVALKNGDQAPFNDALFVAKPSADGLGIEYEYSDGTLHCTKSFRFTQNSYLSDIVSQVTDSGKGVPHRLEWRGGFGDSTVLNRTSAQQTVHYDVANTKLFTNPAKDAKNGPVSSVGNFSFLGIDDTFFAAVFLPRENVTTEITTYSDNLTVASTGKPEAHVGVGVGGDPVNRFQAYVGPKDIDILRRVDPRLPQLIDWGWFGIIAKPLFYALHWINDKLIHNYGWSIVVATIIINVLILPLRLSTMKSAKRMQALQPELAVIKAKYKKVGFKDPKKAQENEETMALYKKHGINPMGGCLPMLVQLPLIYAFYKVLAVTIELRGAHWLWVADLSQPEQLPIHLLPVIMIVTQFFMQKMTPNPTMDPTQAKMMLFMPLMFGFFFYNMQSGLVLYWLTSNLVGIAQQWIINRSMPPVPVAATPQPAPRKKVSRG